MVDYMTNFTADDMPGKSSAPKAEEKKAEEPKKTAEPKKAPAKKATARKTNPLKPTTKGKPGDTPTSGVSNEAEPEHKAPADTDTPTGGIHNETAEEAEAKDGE